MSIRAIAERVGVTPPSIYRHFEDKEAMLGAVCAEVFVQLTDGHRPGGRRRRSRRSTPSPRRVAATSQFGLEHPEHYRLVFMRPPFKGDDVDHSDLRPVLEAGVIPESHPLFSGDALAGSQAFKALYDLVDVVLADVPKRRRPDVFTVTTSMWTAMHGITSLRISKPDFVWPSVEVADRRHHLAVAWGATSRRRVARLDLGTEPHEIRKDSLPRSGEEVWGPAAHGLDHLGRHPLRLAGEHRPREVDDHVARGRQLDASNAVHTRTCAAACRGIPNHRTRARSASR